jgi:hypothetical protein
MRYPAIHLLESGTQVAVGGQGHTDRRLTGDPAAGRSARGGGANGGGGGPSARTRWRHQGAEWPPTAWCSNQGHVGPCPHPYYPPGPIPPTWAHHGPRAVPRSSSVKTTKKRVGLCTGPAYVVIPQAKQKTKNTTQPALLCNEPPPLGMVLE